MDYYYDLFLNFQDEYYMFYEWLDSDSVEYIKKIPLIHIDKKMINILITSNFRVSLEFLNKIKNKTKLKDGESLKYACIFSDNKNSLAVEFNDTGESISKSSLSLEDELNISDFINNIEIMDITYEVINTLKERLDTRQDAYIKKVIKLEIDNIYNNKEYSKLKYIYLEWFKELSSDADMIYNKMIERINHKLTKEEYKIYKLIKELYNRV